MGTDTPKVKAVDDMFFTVTMAEILEAQGCLEDALSVYMILASSSPEDKTLASNVERLKGLGTRTRKKKITKP